ncbi:hypothetical protein EYC84_005915 [Monilinia fructicola]|uniref:Aminotransferase class I/classII large domain-containing protein n=1 Tax=Monilinia fructicola TaxID=38448 RepID=A0A5M9K376_MONFR|nr:hypothetical protein EYC84_005915 [Monilinia fructicola]
MSQKWDQSSDLNSDNKLGITEAFKADSFKEKINLGLAYQMMQVNPTSFPPSEPQKTRSFKQSSTKNMPVLPVSQISPRQLLSLLMVRDQVLSDRLVITQSISGTGALRIGGAFLARFYPGAKKIYIPTPSWANHAAVFKDSGLEVEKYRYYNKDTIGLDFEGLIADIKAAPKGSAFLLHACAHNPTGVDPTVEQWKEISNAIKAGEHYAFFDMAYQGFASGDTDKDAFPIRHFIEQGHNPCLAQSFAKNMGLYGEQAC